MSEVFVTARGSSLERSKSSKKSSVKSKSSSKSSKKSGVKSVKGKKSRKISKLECKSDYKPRRSYNNPDFTVGSEFCKTLDIREGKTLGEGSFGLTKLNKLNDKEYAIKFICKDKFDMAEAELLSNLSSNPLSKKYIGVIVEYCASRNMELL